MIRIYRSYVREIGDDEKIDSVEKTCCFSGGDYALQYIPPKLHIYRVFERE